jgi:hypothetical protein
VLAGHLDQDRAVLFQLVANRRWANFYADRLILLCQSMDLAKLVRVLEQQVRAACVVAGPTGREISAQG